jgi:hypothetical protein
MDESLLNTLRAVEETVRSLIEKCRKNGRIYLRDPRAVAHVSRTGKWHLNAIANLRKVFDAPGDEAESDGSKRDT